MLGRILIFGAAAIVAVALIGAGGWFYYLNFSPDRAKYPVRGIDVSHHQGEIDWATVAADDVRFAIIKATEGGDHVDEDFARNFAAAREAGIAVGAYHFFTFCRPGAEQAANFLAQVPQDVAQLPPVIDIEFGGNCSQRPTVEALEAEIAAFTTPVEAAFGQPVMIYLIGDAAEAYVAAIPDRRMWVRSLAWHPGDADWTLWQYHNRGRVEGIEGDVDLNVLQGGDAALDALVR